MRSLNEPILTAGDASGNLTSDPVPLEYQYGISIQAVITGTAAGTLNLQGSNDFGNVPPGGPDRGQGVTNWTDIAGSSAPVTGAGTVTWNFQGVYYKWIRMVYTASSGTGTMSARANTKGT